MKLFRSITIALSLFFTVGCNLSEDLSDCVTAVGGEGIQLTFSFTDSDGQEAFGTRVPSLSAFVFDERELFVGRWDELDNTKFTEDYVMTLPLPAGIYNIIVWGGIDAEHYELAGSGDTRASIDLQEGVSRIDDLQVRLLADSDDEVSFIPGNKFHGEVLNRIVTDATDNDILINLKKNNKEIRLTIIGIPMPKEEETRANPYTQIDMWLEAANGVYDFHNAMDEFSTTMTYRTPHEPDSGPVQWTDGQEYDAMFATFHTLRLQLRDSGGETMSHPFSIYNADVNVTFKVDLLHDYIHKTEQGMYNTQAKIDAEDVFDVVIYMPEDGPDSPWNGSNAGVIVFVNDYKVNTTGSVLQ
jgi:hypothetical protein